MTFGGVPRLGFNVLRECMLQDELITLIRRVTVDGYSFYPDSQTR